MSARQDRRFTPPAHEPALAREALRSRGIYYTPPEIARQLVERTLAPLLAAADRCPRVIDPACGAGEFLVEVAARLLDRFAPDQVAAAIDGIDIDVDAASVARQRLARFLGRPTNVHHGDALADDWFAGEGYDCVVGNPPFVNIRQLAKALPRERIDYLRRRFRTARGNFDLYVCFVERSLALLRPGGRCGLVLPNKWQVLDYARGCRELLESEATVEEVIDLSDQRVFRRANVYPHLVVFTKRPVGRAPRIVGQASRLPSTVSLVAGYKPAPLRGPLDVESRVATLPLAQVAKLSCGTAGYAAAKIAARLIDSESGPANGSTLDFITSGNIDRYRITLGNVRYLRRTHRRPLLPLAAPELTTAKRRLFSEPKIVIAGISRRLEAAWDSQGLALGVGVYAASDILIHPQILLALLNSKLLTYLFATRFAAKRLAGGYFAINKGQLAQLPIARGAGVSPALKRLLAKRDACPTEVQLDRAIYELYRLTELEIALVENHFADQRRGAA